MKVRVGQLRLDDGHVPGKLRVERTHHAVGAMPPPGQREVHHLPTRVHALVGTPSRCHSHRVAAIQRRQRVLQRVLPAQCARSCQPARLIPRPFKQPRHPPAPCGPRPRGRRRAGSGSRGNQSRRSGSCSESAQGFRHPGQRTSRVPSAPVCCESIAIRVAACIAPPVAPRFAIASSLSLSLALLPAICLPQKGRSQNKSPSSPDADGPRSRRGVAPELPGRLHQGLHQRVQGLALPFFMSARLPVPAPASQRSLQHGAFWPCRVRARLTGARA